MFNYDILTLCRAGLCLSFSSMATGTLVSSKASPILFSYQLTSRVILIRGVDHTVSSQRLGVNYEGMIITQYLQHLLSYREYIRLSMWSFNGAFISCIWGGLRLFCLRGFIALFGFEK